LTNIIYREYTEILRKKGVTMTRKLCVFALMLIFLIISGQAVFAKGGSEKSSEESTLMAFDDVKFAVITDIHLVIPQQKGNSDGYRLGLKTAEILEKTVEEFNKTPDLDYVLVTGDLTVDAEPWNIDAAKSILDRLNVPYFVILGNHD
jgi:metallophosphoesterase superfamily enzyme